MILVQIAIRQVKCVRKLLWQMESSTNRLYSFMLHLYNNYVHVYVRLAIILYIISEFVVSCRVIFDFVLRSSNVIFGLHYLKDHMRCMVQKK